MASVPFHPPSRPAVTPTAAVQAALLKELGKQLVGTVGGDPLRVGQVVTARVGAGPDGVPMLMIGATKVAAQLPGDLQLGQQLRLQVKQSTPERVVLQIVKDPAGAAQATPVGLAGAASELGAASATQGPAQQAAANAIPPWAVVPMPGGAQARVWLDPEQDAGQEAGGAQARTRTMVIRYDSPVLGRTDIVLRLDPAQLDATVLAHGGTALELVRRSVPELRLALAGAVDRPVAIVTGGRGEEEVDVHA